ncbi:MAG: hypothetical protein OD811_01310 [Alphaproteobacteria bacterium]
MKRVRFFFLLLALLLGVIMLTQAAPFANPQIANAQSEEEVQQFIKEQTELIAASPEEADLYGQRGALQILVAEYDLAMQDFQQVLKLSKDPDIQAAAYLGLGTAYAGMENYEEALKQTVLSLEKGSDGADAQAYFFRGLLYEATGDLESANENFERATALGWGQ